MKKHIKTKRLQTLITELMKMRLMPLLNCRNEWIAEPSGGENQNCAMLYKNDRYYFHDDWESNQYHDSVITVELSTPVQVPTNFFVNSSLNNNNQCSK
ncbi:hypothetical protein Avbf_19200 [Armadillidium vulgare]|nr:hypothetical protein Avbf_19200 [Armadillidium vulgare]